MEPRLRRVLDSVLAQESEDVRVAVLQHFVDKGIMELILVPGTIERVLTDKYYSFTIPDDPRMHELLLQLLVAVQVELRELDDSSYSAHGFDAGAAVNGGTNAVAQPDEAMLTFRGPNGHRVLDAAAQVIPLCVFQPFIKALLANCSAMAASGPLKLSGVLSRTYSTTCPALSKDALSAFRKRIWPRHGTVVELEGYVGVTSSSRLAYMEPRLRRVLDSVLAQESEDVRVAVLQHFVDKGITKLASAPGTIGEAMPAHPSFRSLILLRLAGRPASSSC
ncbi:hypothetical protein ABPG77_008546 [Micractinium sp. CCAP 211/92]